MKQLKWVTLIGLIAGTSASFAGDIKQPARGHGSSPRIQGTTIGDADFSPKPAAGIASEATKPAAEKMKKIVSIVSGRPELDQYFQKRFEKAISSGAQIFASIGGAATECVIVLSGDQIEVLRAIPTVPRPVQQEQKIQSREKGVFPGGGVKYERIRSKSFLGMRWQLNVNESGYANLFTETKDGVIEKGICNAAERLF